MYYLVMEGHNCSYEIYEMLALYYPLEKIHVCSRDSLPGSCNVLMSSIVTGVDVIDCTFMVGVMKDGQYSERCHIVKSFKGEVSTSAVKDAVKVSAFEAFQSITGIKMPWGILVGIRPSKIVSEMKNRGCGQKEIEKSLKEKYITENDKINLLEEVSRNSYHLINSDPEKISVYIGIPFCPTRCLYCSFASYSICKYKDSVNAYLHSLMWEMEYLSPFIMSHFKVENIYIGGGTPTSISNDDFIWLLSAVKKYFVSENLSEFTVEGGRPDTINKFKLEAMRQYNVTRISINPQTMNDETLKTVGRSHTVQDVVDAFRLSRIEGFDNINMDMILGLPGEDIRNIKKTVEKLLELSPESITVHSMAIKRASRLKEEIIKNDDLPSMSLDDAWEAMDYVQQSLKSSGYLPYYLYRQKAMVGNLENTGYCKEGYQCSYNIQEIEEKQTIIGFGADAVTKAVFPDSNRIERFANKKDLKVYMDTIEENTQKKFEFLKLLT